VNDDVDPYLIPGIKVLRNRLGMSDARRFDRIERRLVADRIAEGAPIGTFDLTHLRAIHRHLFQDVYDWAGELRTVEINKGGRQFQFRRYIQTERRRNISSNWQCRRAMISISGESIRRRGWRHQR
jgi:fido (protein-threonine AMPylation protein)